MKRLVLLILTCMLLVSSFVPVFAIEEELIRSSLNLEKKLISINYEVGVKISPKYIVIHETGGYEEGVTPDRIYSYWRRDPNAKTSTHFIVDENKVLQLLELNWKGWHVGDNVNHSDITNANSIGIEICVNDDGDYMAARARAIRLVKYLMNELDIDVDHVVRHYDASGKFCPEIMMRFPVLWDDFKNQLLNSDLIIDGFNNEIQGYENNSMINSQNFYNTFVDSKISLKKYNISPFLWNIINNYPQNLNNQNIYNSRNISNIGINNSFGFLYGLSAMEVNDVLSQIYTPQE